MGKAAFQKGFASGFLSPLTFFLPPVREQRNSPASEVSALQQTGKAYRSRVVADVSVAAAWARTGEIIAKAMTHEMGEIDAGNGNAYAKSDKI